MLQFSQNIMFINTVYMSVTLISTTIGVTHSFSFTLRVPLC